MSAFYPPSSSYVCRKLDAYSCNRYTLYPQSLQTAGPNDVIVVSRPANALVDLQSLAMHFSMSTTTTTGFAAAPRHIECLIDSIAVECNGMIVDQAALLYGHVFKMWMDVMGGDKGPQRAILQNGAGSATAPAANLTNQQYASTNWLGFLGSSKPSSLDTSLTGPIRIYINMAPAAVQSHQRWRHSRQLLPELDQVWHRYTRRRRWHLLPAATEAPREWHAHRGAIRFVLHLLRLAVCHVQREHQVQPILAVAGHAHVHCAGSELAHQRCP